MYSIITMHVFAQTSSITEISDTGIQGFTKRDGEIFSFPQPDAF